MFVDSLGQRLFTHSAIQCIGQPCVIHNQTDHQMAGWPQVYRHDLRLMTRVCSHQVQHPDPDEINLHVSDRSAHHCDGCCSH